MIFKKILIHICKITDIYLLINIYIVYKKLDAIDRRRDMIRKLNKSQKKRKIKMK